MKQLTKILAAAVLGCTIAACGSKPAEAPAGAAGGDGQNPVMNVVGDYQADRCSVHVEADGTDGARISVHWGSSASESAEWTMSGTFDTENHSVYYQDGVKKNVVYGSDGKITSEEEVYTGGHGTFIFNAENNTLTWEEDQEHIADGMVFEYISAAQ